MSELIDNRAKRIQTLKEIIRRLHEGEAPDAVRGQLREIVRETSSTEIAAMEQELMADGMPVSEVQGMCDLHSQVLREFLVEPERVDVEPGHPLDTLRRENEALLEAIREARAWANDDSQPDSWREVVGRLMDVEKHYQRKENLLFSYLERHGIAGPSKVMWAKDDEVRAFLRVLDERTRAGDVETEERRILIDAVAEPTLQALEEMVHKETAILFPMASETLTEDEWAEIWKESPRYGYCLIQPAMGYRPSEPKGPGTVAEVPAGQAIVFASGALEPSQLEALFRVLPVDLTFVDADDRVRWFSEGPDRVFERSRAIIGRKVQHCHPPKSVHMVEEIVAAFREGRRDQAAFWIEFGGRFVHIRYFAVRDEADAYLGTLEVTQDLTPLRALSGERRLLEWEA